MSHTAKMILTYVRRLAPIASHSPALPGPRRSVSLRFRVAMLLKHNSLATVSGGS